MTFLGKVLFSLVDMSHGMVQVPGALHLYSVQKTRAEAGLEQSSGTKNT